MVHAYSPSPGSRRDLLVEQTSTRRGGSVWSLLPQPPGHYRVFWEIKKHRCYSMTRAGGDRAPHGAGGERAIDPGAGGRPVAVSRSANVAARVSYRCRKREESGGEEP